MNDYIILQGEWGHERKLGENMKENFNIITKLIQTTKKSFKVLSNNTTTKYTTKVYVNKDKDGKYSLASSQPFGANDHTEVLELPEILSIDENKVFSKEAQLSWDDLLYNYKPHDREWGATTRDMSQQESIWDDDEHTDLMELIGSDWVEIHANEKDAIKDALEQKDAQGLLEVLQSIDWDTIHTDTRLPLLELNTIGAIELKSTNIVVESKTNPVPYVRLWHKNTKLLVPTMIKREYLYKFLQDPLQDLQESIVSLMNKFNVIKEWKLPFRVMLKSITSPELHKLNGRELHQIHRGLFSLRQMISENIKDLFRSPDVQTFDYKYDKETINDEDTSGYYVIENNPLLLLDAIVDKYMMATLEDIKIAENISRSMILNPIEVKSTMDLFRIPAKVPEIVWKVYDNTSKDEA